MRCMVPVLAVFLLLFAGLASAAAPVVQLTAPNGGEYISAASGNYNITFNVSDADNNALLSDIYLSASAGAKTTLIVGNLNLEGASCTDVDNNNVTTNSCTYSWNPAGINGTYYMDVVVRDAAESSEDSSNASFIVDNTVPNASNARPANGTYVSSASQQISVDLNDSLSGINTSTIVMRVRGIDYNVASAELDYAGTASQGTVNFVPSTSFVHMEVVSVTLNAMDNAGNAMPALNFGFTVDLELPDINSISPVNGAYTPDENQQVSAVIGDAFSGMNTANIIMGVEGADYNLMGTQLVFAGTPAAGIITFTPGNPFSNAQQVDVRMSVPDLAGNTRVRSWNFTVDLAAPVVTAVIPNDTNRYTKDLQQDINFLVYDALSRVDWNTLVVTVEGVSYPFDSPYVRFNTTSGLVYFENPTAFQQGQDVNVSVAVADRVGNSSATSWGFTIDVEPAFAISDLKGFVSNYAQVELNWTQPSYTLAPIDYYNVYRSNLPISDYNKGMPYAAHITARNYTDSAVEIGKTYYYVVTSVDRAGNESGVSNSVRLTITADVMMVLDNNVVALQSGESIGVGITVNNHDSARHCVKLTPDTNSYNYLTLSILGNSFCLNRGEQSSVTMAIAVDRNTPIGDYSVEVEMEYENGKKLGNVLVKVLGSGMIDFSLPAEATLTKEGYTKRISGITVTNYGSEMKEVTLTAESELFLPVFEPASFKLYAGQARPTELVLHINETTALGEYVIPVFVHADNYYLEREIKLIIKEPEREKAAFRLSVPSACIQVSKDSERQISFSVYNLLNEEQTVTLIASGDLMADVNSRELTLPANGSASTFVKVKARSTDSNGEHTITLYAYNDKYDASEEICTVVGPYHSIMLSVPDNNGFARACSAQEMEVFEVSITNVGDYDETVRLGIDNPYSTIGVNISDEEFLLQKGKSKTVYVAVTPSFDTPLGDKIIYLNAYSERGADEEPKITIGLENFSESMRESTIRLRVGSTTYDTSSARLDFDSATGTLTFEPTRTYSSDEAIDMKLTFEDSKGNDYEIEFDYNVGRNAMEDLLVSIAIDSGYITGSIDEDSIGFEYAGTSYDIDDQGLSYSSSARKVTFTADRDYSGTAVRKMELNFENTDGNEYSISADLRTEFDIGDYFLISQPLYFTVVEPSLGLGTGVLEITSYPTKITAKPGESKFFAVTLRNPTGIDMENVKVKLWGLNSKVFFPVLDVGMLRGNEIKEVSGELVIGEDALPEKIMLTLEAKSDEYIDTKAVELTITPAAATAEQPGVLDGTLAGLVGFASGIPAGIAAVALAILVVLAVIAVMARR